MNKDQEVGLLRRWRRRAGLKANEVDRLLELPDGSIKKLERLGIAKVPLSILARIIQTYRLSPRDALPLLYKTIGEY